MPTRASVGQRGASLRPGKTKTLAASPNSHNFPIECVEAASGMSHQAIWVPSSLLGPAVPPRPSLYAEAPNWFKDEPWNLPFVLVTLTYFWLQMCFRSSVFFFFSVLLTTCRAVHYYNYMLCRPCTAGTPWPRLSMSSVCMSTCHVSVRVCHQIFPTELRRL